MTQDRTQRTVDEDAEWTPFGGAVRETGSAERTVDADARPSTVHAASAGWRPRVIEGGRGHEDKPGQDGTSDTSAAEDVDGSGVDLLDAVTADVLGILDAPVDAAPEAPAAVEPEPAPAVPEAAAEVITAPAAVPGAPAQEPTPHPTLHTPGQATPKPPAPAQSDAEAAETPHSTPWLRTAVGWLNPYDILDQPLPPVSAIYEAAATTVTDRSGFDRVTEIGWVYAIGMPVTVACYTLAAAVQHKARGIGVGLTVLAWVLAADAAPVDTSVIWWWTALGYWVSTVFILPAVIQAKK